VRTDGVELVFGIAALLSGGLMTFVPEALYDWQAKMFYSKTEFLGMLRFLGPIPILLGVVLLIIGFVRVL
jgi:hypothetical protein